MRRVSCGCEVRQRPRRRVGPFAYLRPGAVLRERVQGRARSSRSRTRDIGAGAKVPHLSYIGDADVGEGTNLGAGHDHRQLRRRRQAPHDDRRAACKSGVDTTFVAPVTVGDDAWTAAGSVITDDVPAGALAVARARQRNVEGYAERASATLSDAARPPA